MVTRTGPPVRARKPQSTASMRRAGAAQSQAVTLYSPATSEYVFTPVGHSVLRIHMWIRTRSSNGAQSKTQATSTAPVHTPARTRPQMVAPAL